MDFARQLKSSIDIVDVVGERVRLKRSGNTPNWMGLCPFHTEKTPSFNVNSKIQRYKCFGCGEGGDVIKFVMEMDGVTFLEAMQALAERYGIPMPQRTEHSDREERIRNAIFRMNEIAQRLFRQAYLSPQGAEARAYVQGRNVSAETAEEFGIGLSQRGGNAVLQALQREGFSAELLEKSGLVKKRTEGEGFYDVFRGRLIFPIQNESGKIVGFAGRVLTKGDEPKYLNSPETDVYRKSRVLYNIHRAREAARKEGRFVLVEGYMDVIGLSAAGLGEAVASCGTSLTSDQVRLMKRFADKVTVNFDPDAGGARGAERSIEILLHESVRVKILELSNDLDPDEFIEQQGVDAYRTLLERAPNYYFWLADQLRKRHEKSPEGRTRVLQLLLPAVMKIPDKIERASLAGDLASYIGVERGMLLEQFKKAAADKRQETIEVKSLGVRSVEKILLGALVLHPELRAEVIPQLEGNAAVGEFRTRSIFEAILNLYHHHPGFAFEDLEGRLSEADQTLLSRLVFADELQETGSAEAIHANVQSCLKVLDQELKEVRQADLRRQIREAEQRGDLNTALQLMQQLDKTRER
ncbi:MAG: DNA primase [Acidobacteria bacterium]|nr:DNA primase [Acidobacteriota bacterium]